ncbi:MAG: hypothetical protein K2X87_20130 [Gemmataceae bacterium]|nr:hypothetical protein [Gemmataceae bacterium]
MAIDFTGTNTEKTDKLIAAVVEQRTTLRLFLFAVGLGLPLVVGLQVSVVVESFRTTAKLDRLADRVDRLAEQQTATQAKVDRLVEQQTATQAEVRTLRTEVGQLAKEQAATRAEVQALGGRIERLEQRVGKP